MFGRRSDTCVYQATRYELRTRLFGGTFKGELRKLCERGMRCDGAMIIISRGSLDDCDDQVIRLRVILQRNTTDQPPSGDSESVSRRCWSSTLPLVFSIQAAFFFRSTKREPARTAVIDEGGTRRKPGPILRGELGEVGKSSEEMISPGRTTVPPAMI